MYFTLVDVPEEHTIVITSVWYQFLPTVITKG